MDKTCIRCEIAYPLESYQNKADAADGKQSYCRKCRAGLAKAHRLAKPEMHRANVGRANRRRKYGLSEPEFQALVSRSGGRCGICGAEAALCVDHCHETSRVRGLLCLHCNLGLGHFRDDPERMQAAIAYLAVVH